MSGQLCEMCDKPMHPFSKQSTCGAACRQKKSRLKANAYQIAIDAKQGIKTLIKGLELNLLNANDLYADYKELEKSVSDLLEAIYARDKRAEVERTYEEQKRRK